MAAAQRQLQASERSGLPVAVPQKTQKDRLYNDLIGLASELKLKWRSPSSDGTSFLKKLANVLWYLDGHHDTIKEKSSKIPDIFQCFNG